MIKPKKIIPNEVKNIASCQIAFGGNRYLLDVPDFQKKWFMENYKYIKNKIEETELIGYQMFENNLFGKDDRFINWTSDKNGLIDDYIENYICNEKKTLLLRDVLICFLEDCIHFECFEMAHNINLILMSFDCVFSGYFNEELKDKYWFKKI
jgi:hypothetical protein